MIANHPRRYVSGLGGLQNVAVRREVREQRTERVFRMSGVVIVTVMILSVMASIWYGWRIGKGLGDLAWQRQEFTRNTGLNRELAGRRDDLLAPKMIVRKAAVLGLFPPSPKQVRTP